MDSIRSTGIVVDKLLRIVNYFGSGIRYDYFHISTICRVNFVVREYVYGRVINDYKQLSVR